MKQRVLSRAEYAAVGYQERGDLSGLNVKLTPDEPLGSAGNFPVYRASEKEEYYFDFGVGVVKVGVAITTGGISAGLRTGATYILSRLT